MNSDFPTLTGEALERGETLAPRFDANGLIAAIAQHAETREILMIGWMNAEALRLTLAEGRVVYFSRSRNKGVNVYSEQTRTVYSQNIGQTRGYGLQLSAGLTPLSGLRLFGALSYSRSQFSEDVRTNNGAWLPVKHPLARR